MMSPKAEGSQPNERADRSNGLQITQLAYRCVLCGLRWATFSSSGTPDLVCPFYGHDDITWRKVA